MATKNAALPGTPTGQVVAETAYGLFRGYNFRETTGSAAVVLNVYAGSSNAGTMLATVAVPAGTSVDVSLSADNAPGFSGGLYVETVSGTTPAGFVRWSGAV